MDEETRRATKPAGIARAELILGLMERFSYPSLKALRKESAEILQLLEAESFGEKAFQRDEIEKQRQRQEEQTQELETQAARAR